MDLVVKGGTVVNAGETFRADVGVSGGKIAALGLDIDPAGADVVDASEKLVFPGMIDVHTHMQLPFGGTVSADDFESGTAAAAFGGVTTIIDFAIQAKGESLAEAIRKRRAEADGKVVVDYGLHACMTDARPEVMAEVAGVISSGYPTFKLFMTYQGLAVDDGALYATMREAAANGGMVGVHAENFKVIEHRIASLLARGEKEPRHHAVSRPPFCEEEAVGRAVLLAAAAGSPVYIFHLSTSAGLERIKRARDEGGGAHCETCPQYLLLTADRYDEPGFNGAKYVMSPPLRTDADREALWKGLASGDVEVVGSDHCPFTMEQKGLGLGDFTRIPNGAPGVETTLPLLYTEGVLKKRIDLNRLVAVLSANPAGLFGLAPGKGSVAVGADADVVVFDPGKEVTLGARTLHMKTDYSPYEGWKVKGYPVVTVSRGEVVCRDGRLLGRAGRGRFVARRGPG